MMKFRYLFVIALLCTALSAQKVALLVETASGANVYTEKDVVTMQRLLGNSYTYIILPSKKATSTRIRKELQNMSKLKKSDTFVFYYSGHGARFTTGDSTEEDHQDDFLVTSDASCVKNNITKVLTDNELNYLYAKIPAKKVVLIDACHSHTMYKGMHDTSATKVFKGCGGNKLSFGGKTHPEFLSIHPSNFLHIGAANEREAAEGSKDGGIFTLALEKALKENGNIPFSTLINKIQENIKPIAARFSNTNGAFVPSLATKDLNANKLYTKDIFVLPNYKPKENSLKEYLNSKLSSLKLLIHGKKSKFRLGEDIILKSKIADKPSHIYLIDMLDKNNYKLMDSRTEQECIGLPATGQRYCQYRDLVGSAPFGKSEVYLIVSPKPLVFSTPSKDIIRVAKSLEEQLKGVDFKVAKVSFTVHP